MKFQKDENNKNGNVDAVKQQPVSQCREDSLKTETKQPQFNHSFYSA